MRMTKALVLSLLIAVFVLSLGATAQAQEKAWLGVMLQPLTVDLKEAMDLKQDLSGVLISDVVDDSPADEAGLEDGDIIIEIDGEEIRTVSGATKAIGSFSPGDDVKIVVLRDGDKKKVIEVELGEREGKTYVYDDDSGHGHLEGLFEGFMDSDQGYLGVRIEGISSDLGDYFGVDEGEGVLVLEVVDDSPAEDAGIKAGDIILKIDGKEIEDTDELVKYVRKSEPGEEIEITLKRKRRTQTVEAELGEAPGIRKQFMREFKMPGKGRVKRIMIDSDNLRDEIEDEIGDIKVFEFDRQHLKDEMEDLREEMEKLKKEVQKLSDELKGS
jgi:C-terminal processing protease CtpA/Prc